jgi:general secretion pathway protein G
MRTRTQKGFTLVEILIVVVILGILAAIVIPQFSEASTEAKISSSLSSLQTLRSQISLYKIQHNDNPPKLGVFEAAMTKCSNANAAAVTDYADRSTENKTTHPYGPYLQSVPKNPWNDSDTVAAADGAEVGWVYDDVTGDIYLAIDGITNATAKQTLIDNGAALATP